MTRPISRSAGASTGPPFPLIPARRSAGELPSSATATVERRNHTAREQVVQRMRCEFAEMPGLHLTFAQVSRLLGLRPDICRRILTSLVSEGYLRTQEGGQYCRRGVLP